MPYHDLLTRLQLGDEEALSSLMKEFYDDMYNYAYKLVKDDGVIKDAIQEVFISLWQRRNKALSITSPRFYLLRATKNIILKGLQKKRNIFYSDAIDVAYDFEIAFSIEKIIIDKQVTEDQAARLRHIIGKLSARQREIIYLTFYQQLNTEEIAELMNINRQSVYNLLHESLQKIRSFWQQQPVLSDVHAACLILAVLASSRS